MKNNKYITEEIVNSVVSEFINEAKKIPRIPRSGKRRKPQAPSSPYNRRNKPNPGKTNGTGNGSDLDWNLNPTNGKTNGKPNGGNLPAPGGNNPTNGKTNGGNLPAPGGNNPTNGKTNGKPNGGNPGQQGGNPGQQGGYQGGYQDDFDDFPYYGWGGYGDFPYWNGGNNNQPVKNQGLLTRFMNNYANSQANFNDGNKFNGMLESTNNHTPINEDVNEEGWFTLDDKVRKWVGRANINDVREAFGVLYEFTNELKNQEYNKNLIILARGVNATIKKDSDKLSTDDIDTGDYYQSSSDATANTALNVAYDVSDIAGRSSGKKAAQVAAKTAEKKAANAAIKKTVGSTALKTGGKVLGKTALTGGLKAALGPVGWIWLGVDVLEGAIDIINAAKNAKDPSRAPLQAIATMQRYFKTRGKKGNTKEVQQSMANMTQILNQYKAQLEGNKNTKEVQDKNVGQNKSAFNLGSLESNPMAMMAMMNMLRGGRMGMNPMMMMMRGGQMGMNPMLYRMLNRLRTNPQIVNECVRETIKNYLK